MLNTKYLTIACLLFIGITHAEITQLFENDSSENFIIRWGFQDLCDHIFDPYYTTDLWPTCENSGGTSLDPEDVQKGDVIFVRNIDLFMKEMHPKIQNPYIILTHGEHHETTHEHQLSYLNEKKIIAWFAIHPFKDGHPKYFSLPLGIQQFKSWYINKTEFNGYLKNLRETTPKSNLVYLNFNLDAHPDRRKLYDSFCNEHYCVVRTKKISYEEYLKDMAQCKFALAPRGLGPDTYRAWEALLVGTIPIVKRGVYEDSSFFDGPAPQCNSSLDNLYRDLPVLIVDDWDELTPEFLNKKYSEIVAKKYDISPLYLEYWKQKINTVREIFLLGELYEGTFHSCQAKSEAFKKSDIDVTIVGSIKYADGIGRIPIGIIDIFKDELTINHKRMAIGAYDFDEVPSDIEKVIKNPVKTPGNVALFTSGLWYTFGDLSQEVPDESFIKIAYSMLESSSIPLEWVQILNNKFDIVAVPDEYYKEIYRNCGVKIPIVVLPHGIYLDELLQEPFKEQQSPVFTFGLTAVYSTRKNQELLVKAFLEEFCNDPQVKLKLHGRWGDEKYLRGLQQQIYEHKAQNVEWSQEILSEKECQNFLKSLDCYVLLSRGEGFSVTPREAMALGIPCILANNTAHKSICRTGLVYAVESDIEEPADYGDCFCSTCGNYYNCSVENVRKAMREVYTNYEYYKNNARKGREWASQFTWSHLKARFRNLIKPTTVILGDQDIVTDDYLMTTSKALYTKYKKLSRKA